MAECVPWTRPATCGVIGEASEGGSAEELITASVQTTDATLTTLYAKAIAASGVTTLKAWISAKCTAGTNAGKVFSGELAATAINGTPEELKPGANFEPISVEVEGWEARAAYNATDNEIRLTVKGAAGDTINWLAKIIEINL